MLNSEVIRFQFSYAVASVNSNSRKINCIHIYPKLAHTHKSQNKQFRRNRILKRKKKKETEY